MPDIALMGAVFHDVPAVDLPIDGGGTATFTDVTDTTAAAEDVASGKYFYTANGVRTEGTASGGTDVSDTTATAADVVSGKIFYAADGTQTTGTLVKHGSALVSVASQASATTLRFSNVAQAPTRVIVRCKPSSAVSLSSTALTVSLNWTSSSVSAVYASGSSSTYKLTPVTSGFSVSHSGTTLTISASGTAKFNTNAAVWELTYYW